MTQQEILKALEDANAKIATLEATLRSRVKVRLTQAKDMVAIQLPTRRYEITLYKDEVPLLMDEVTIKQVLEMASTIPDNLPRVNKAAIAANGTNGRTYRR
jgi:hypothetical protein